MLESRQGSVFRSKQRARQGSRVILCSLKARKQNHSGGK